MSDPGPSPFKYHLELTPAQLRLTHDALSAMADHPGSDERARRIIGEVLDMLPDEEHISQIRLTDDGEDSPGGDADEADPPDRTDPPDLPA